MKRFLKKTILLIVLALPPYVWTGNTELSGQEEKSVNKPPSTVISCNVKEGFIPLEAEFSSEGTTDPDGKIISYLWTFGDGKESSQPNPKHIFTKPATYFVRFGVIDDENAVAVSEPLKIVVKDSSPFGVNKKRLQEFKHRQLRFAYEQRFRLGEMYRSGPYVRNEIDIAATGFSLAGLCIAAEDGLIARENAESLAFNTILRCRELQNDSETNFAGFLYHFYLWNETGTQFYHKSDVEVSTIDTALLLAGIITAGEYFGGRVKDKAGEFYGAIDWKKFFDLSKRQFHMAYRSGDFFGYWDYYTDEILLIALFASGAPDPDFRVAPEDAFSGWRVNFERYNLGEGYAYSWWGSLFTYLYAHMFFDFNLLGEDKFYNINWWQNSRRAAQADIDFCRDNSYPEDVWGLSACWSRIRPKRDEWEYRSAVGGGLSGGGSRYDNKKNKVWPIAVHGAISALPFFDCGGDLKNNPAFLAWDFTEKYIYNHESFIVESLDANNPDKEGRPLKNSDFTVGMDMLTPAIMIENAFSGLIWKYFMQNRYVRNACKMIFYQATLFDNF